MVKKQINKEQIDSVKSSLCYKIFDLLKINDKKYYLDKEYNLIWDENKKTVGIIFENKNIFFSEMDEYLKKTDDEMNEIIKKYELLI